MRVPIEIAGLELARGGVAAVGNSHRAAHAKSALGEIKPVARDAPDAVERRPLDELGADAALQNKILQQPPHVVVGKRRGDCGFQAEAPAQAARHIVFAAALPDFELARGADAALARIEAKHDFAERNQVVLAL